MQNFREQIDSDISDYQMNNPHIRFMEKNEWAFNYWVLDKFFGEDENIIEQRITDYVDQGVDAYEIFEESKEIYLIQNKYYDETKISATYVKTNFIPLSLGCLENGTYKKSNELQQFFTKYKDDDNFTVHLQLYITNDKKNIELEEFKNQYNQTHKKYIFEIYYLSDIQDKYYNQNITVDDKQLTAVMETVNSHTVLNINPKEYKLGEVLTAKYAYTPVVSIFRMFKKAKTEKYPIFDKNIREYLGKTSINKKIYDTLIDREERRNFFYYNNGITITCDRIGKERTVFKNLYQTEFDIINPQIVNGCQTVNSIFAALDNYSEDKLETEFKNTFVMVKFLQIKKNDANDKILYENIVKYNNSQNSIDEKTFVANQHLFLRVQAEFEKRGYLVLIKQSDKNTFSEKYKTISNLIKLNHERNLRFGLGDMKTIKDVFIDLSKLLQVINAFKCGAQTAFQRKSYVLKEGSQEYNTSVEFITNTKMDFILDLYLLYLRSETEKKKSKDNRTPNTYYLIDGFARFECQDRNNDLIGSQLDDSSKITKMIKLYSMTTSFYTTQYLSSKETDYNSMIKAPVDYRLFEQTRNSALNAVNIC